jgi:signal transduction histidine kinase
LRTWRVTFFPIQSGGEIRALGATCEDVTVTKHLEAERDRLLDAERAARADAERANGLKDQFLAVVSHELRNPLNAIVGWTQLATQGSLPQDKLADALKRIERNAMAQARLIDDLLDVSRIMTGNLSLVNQPTGLRGPIGATVEALRPEALRKHIALDVDLGSDDIIVDGDSDRLQQVAMNLIGNALKFTPEGGHVEVALRIADGEAQFIVSDTGPGIDPAFLPELFQPFRRADASASRRHQGLGLGLAIARNLVELHGGRIDVANRPDGGAVFRVALPLAEAPAVDATLQPRDAAGDLAGMEVLLVEDNRDTLDMLQQALEGVGAVVEAHDNAVDGLAAAQRRHFDVLVTDIGMPDHDGFWLLEQVRGRQPTIKALAVTAFASAEDRARSLAAGFQRHLAKPMHTEQLIAALRGLVSRPS